MTFAIWFILILGFLIGILNWLPEAGSLSSNFADSIRMIISYTKIANGFLPITEMLQALRIVILYEIAVWTFRQLSSLYHKIRGSGGSGN